MDKKRIYVLGGGTFNRIRTHLALAVPAFGTAARHIANICMENSNLETRLLLTKMADPLSDIITTDDMRRTCEEIRKDPLTKIVFLNAAVTDFTGAVEGGGTYLQRLSTDRSYNMELKPTPKLIDMFRAGEDGRKDIFLVGFKTTSGATSEEQYLAGLNLLKRSSCNLVLANDVVTRNNMVICPEEAVYHETTDRAAALRGLVEMAMLRSHLTFTRSTVVDGQPIPWDSELVYPSLRTIVNYCIQKGAYKKFRGVTAGHFAAKLSDTEFLTSIRKTDFNDMPHVGLVKVQTDGPDSVIAYGAKPSVGGQSQRIVFHEHQEYDCIVHFHCPKLPGSLVPTVSQREYECGSHQCGRNTSSGLKRFGNLSAVFLDQHGPNIVFHHSINPQEVIDFIEQNFNLEEKTGGYRVDKALVEA